MKTKKLILTMLSMALGFVGLGVAALQPQTASAAVMEKVFSADFEDQQTSAFSSNGNSTHSIVTDAHSGDYALKSTLNTGKTQNRIQTNISANSIQESKWYEFSVWLKADAETTMTGYVYFNANTAKELTIVSSSTKVGTEWTEYTFGYSYEVTDNGCELSFRRPNMTSPAKHTFTDINTDVTSFDLILMTSAPTWYMDDLSVKTEKTEAVYQADIIGNDFEDDSYAPWTSSQATMSVVDSDYQGKALRVMRNDGQTQTRFQTNVNGAKIKENLWTTLRFMVKADTQTSLEVISYFNPSTGSPAYLYLSTGTSVGTEWTEVLMGFSYSIVGESLNISFQRPNMTSPAPHSVAVAAGSTLKSMDFVIMTASATTLYIDDISISAPLTVSAAAGEVIDMIDALGEMSAEKKEAVDAATAAYEALTDAQKAEVFNYDVLTQAQRYFTYTSGIVKGEFNEENVVFRFGAISDTHNNNVQNALEILSSWGGKTMDALIMTGDITDRVAYESEPDKYNEIPKVKACFEEYLADDVEMFFCLGNHDSSAGSHAAMFYDGLGERFYRSFTDKEYTRTTGNGHAYINGYHFIAIESDYNLEVVPKDTLTYLENKLKEIVSSPTYNGEYIFVLSHVSPSGTVDAASPITDMVPIVSKYPQVIMLTGHSHSTLYSEMAIMQTDFTTVNLGSVSYTPFEKMYLESKDNLLLTPSEELQNGSYSLSVGTMMEIDADGNVKITRIDFRTNEQIGEPWILPAPTVNKSHLYAYPQERKTTYAEAPTWENPTINAMMLSQNSVQITFDTAEDDSYVHSYLIELFEAGASEPYYSIESLSQFYLYPQASDMPATKTVVLSNLKKLPASVRITPKDTLGLSATAYTATVAKSVNSNVVPTSALVIDMNALTYAMEDKYELSTSADFEAVLPNSGSITEYIGVALYIREKATDFMDASAATEVRIRTYTLEAPNSDEYTIHFAKEKDTYFVNEVIEFCVELSEGYEKYEVIVKVDSAVLEADSDNIYSFVITTNSVITVEMIAPQTFNVTLPTVEGVTITNVTGETTVTEGDVFSFKVEVNEGYDGSALTVKANGKTLTAKDGIYTVKVTDDVTITVSGVTKVSAPSNSILNGGCGSSMSIATAMTLLAGFVVVTIKRKED